MLNPWSKAKDSLEVPWLIQSPTTISTSHLPHLYPPPMSYVSSDKLLIAAVSRVRLPFELASQHPTPFGQHLTASFSNLTSEIGITCASCFDLFPSYSFLLFHPFLNNISTDIFICWLCNTCVIQLLECVISRPLVAKQPDFRSHFIFLTQKIRENAAIRNPLVAKWPDFLCHFIFSQKRMVVLGN